MSAIALIANALQKYKKQMRICYLRADIFEKNIVSTVERHKKWQETTDKMANPLCVGIETTSFRPRRTERRNCGMIIVFSRNGRCRKQRFLHDSIRKGTRNSVAKSKPQGEKVETMYPNWFQQVSINGNNAKVPWRIFWRKWRGVSKYLSLKPKNYERNRNH